MRNSLVTERAEEIQRIASQHGAQRVRAFGARAPAPFARREAT